MVDDVGATYRVLVDGERLTDFEVGAPIEPGQSVSLTVGRPSTRQVVMAAGSACAEETEARTAEIAVDLPAALAPYRDLLWYRTVVNGAPPRYRVSVCAPAHPGRSWRGRGVDEVVGLCDPLSHIEGDHPAEISDVSVKVFLPGTELSWETERLEVDLRCKGAGGCSTTTGGANPWLPAALLLFMARRRRSSSR